MTNLAVSQDERQWRPENRYGIVLTLLCVLSLSLFFLSLLVGPAELSVAEVASALLRGDETADAIRLVIFEIRLPRSILAFAIGAVLGLSGAALQGYLRNPLAEPGLIGASSGAALGAVLAFYSGLSAAFALAVPICGILGALVAVFAVYLLAGNLGSPLTLILAGVAVSAFAGALTSLALNLSPNPFAVTEIVFWLMGSLADRGMDHLRLALPFMVVGSGILFALARTLDGITLGEDVARSLGINLKRTQALLIAGTALGVGAATSVAGAIGFVGLVAPHMLRPFTGGRPGRLLPLSFFGGAALVLAADCAIRVFTPGHEMKLGVLTALVGAPFFLLLILRARREQLQ